MEFQIYEITNLEEKLIQNHVSSPIDDSSENISQHTAEFEDGRTQPNA